MSQPRGANADRLRLLLIEDSADDAHLIARCLRPWFPELAWRQVDTLAALDTALADPPWDMVLCDHGVAGMPTAQTIARVRATAPDVPVVVVSGSADPEAAQAMAGAGAYWFVRKDQLARLPAVVEVLARRDEAPATPDWAPGEAVAGDWRSVFGCLFDAVLVTDPAGLVRYANWGAAALAGGAPADLVGRSLPVRVDGASVDRDVLTGGTFVRLDGRGIPAEVATALLGEGPRAERLWVVRDLTAMRRLRRRLEEQARRHQQRVEEASRRAVELAWLVGGLRLAGRCARRVHAARTPEEVARAARAEVMDVAGLGWTDAAVWLRRPAPADTGEALMVAAGAEGPSIPLAGDHPWAGVVRTGEAAPDVNGALVVPLRGRTRVHGVMVLRWDGSPLVAGARALRAGLGDAAQIIADAQGLAIESLHERATGREAADAPAVVRPPGGSV